MFRLFGWTTSPRHEVTRCVTDVVSAVGGFVLETQRFSNVALMLRIQVQRSRCSELAVLLADCALDLDGDSVNELVTNAERDADRGGDVTATLSIRFVHDEPDLRIETPAVPG